MDYSTFGRIGFSIAFGIILILIPFLKSRPDSRMAKWRNGVNYSWINFATNGDGSLKKHTKIIMAAVFASLLILVWVV
jgi:hypothetical protein